MNIRMTKRQPTVFQLVFQINKQQLSVGYKNLAPRQETKCVEAVLARVPVPELVIDTREDVQVVRKGAEWLLSLHSFYENRYSLKQTVMFKELENSKFEELPRHLQRRIEETRISVVLIEPGTCNEGFQCVSYWLGLE